MNTDEVAVFAGGCFWCTEAIFKRLKGVKNVISGYTGGDTANPSYDEVSSGSTGHSEAVKIIFDPNIIPYTKLLEVFWAVHDPTTLNRQGNDRGTQYRSAIYYMDSGQKDMALVSRRNAEVQDTYKGRIVTEIVPFTVFYGAEEYHQNYYDANPDNPYCSAVINPKIKKLIEKFSKEVKEEYKK